MRRVLVLGGTRDARDLAARLVARGAAVVSSLAGRTREPLLPEGAVRIGGFGGVAGLVAYLREAGIEAVVDATHPFAARMTANAVAACARAGVPRVALVRPAWTPREGDRWTRAATLEEAAALARASGRRIFLTTGRQELAPFAELADRFWLIRAIEPLAEPFAAPHDLVLARGPFAYADERALLELYAIDTIVAKNSGGESASAKLAAARDLGLAVVMLARPPEPPGAIARTLDEALAWLEARVTP